MATLRAALAELLATADSAANAQICDVIGNKDDTLAGNSIMGLLKFAANRLEVINDHLHNASKCYPTLADGVAVTAHATAWTLGTAVEIIPANYVTKPFNIFFVNVEAATATDVYEIVLYSGAAAGTEIGRIRNIRNNTYPEAGGSAIACRVVAANTKISARIASKTGGGVLTLSLFYILQEDWQ